MKNKTHQILESLSIGVRLVTVGFIAGAGAFAFWARYIGIFDGDVRIKIAFMIGMPFLILFAHIPALILEISDGIAKIKSGKNFESQSKNMDRTS